MFTSFAAFKIKFAAESMLAPLTVISRAAFNATLPSVDFIFEIVPI